MMSTPDRKRSRLMMIASMLIVGTIGIFRRYIPLSSALLAFCRGLIGSVSLGLFVLLIKKQAWQKLSAKTLSTLILNGGFLGINWILLFEAFDHTTIAKATLCYYMEPTIVLLLSPLLFREKLTGRKLVCAAVSLLGMVLVSGVIGGDARPSDLTGIFFGLSAACFYSLVVILNKKTPQVDGYQKTIIQLSGAALTLIPYLLFTEDFSALTPDGTTLVLLLLVGVIHTGLVYALYFGSMAGLSAQTISTLSYIDPIVAMIVSALILKEGLSFPALLGAAAILGSALISERP